MDKVTIRWVIALMAIALLALIYAHLLGREDASSVYTGCRGFGRGGICGTWRMQARMESLAVICAAAAAAVVNERRR
ncbi:MAG: hypothetical protein DLM53_12810 [Candidatus Eremiobacter antarcticus]|nr:hypothetical protein [Candidatus Eremiobacteraeota bacterium]MBC5807667.1 hypothetical protein [Candidatus Eremiobacteraeota bacterium]PZR60519.1 MAG: hypothetical protein DLM53_12810 [Candidatus Eremiobacter sp. RRmetagenome_bin22]